MYDVIVVGARCAGSPTAMLLARKGYRVLLVDKATFPSDTMSGHMVYMRGVACLKRWGVLEQLAATGCPPITQTTIDLGPFSLVGMEPPIDGATARYAPRRKVIDQILVNAAVEAGVELREGFTVQKLAMNGEQVTGILGYDAQGESITERATLVVGADGMRSVVAHRVQAPAYQSKPTLSCGYYAYWSGIPMNGAEIYPRTHRIIFALPTNDDKVLIAMQWPRAEFHTFRRNIAGHFMQTLDELAPDLASRVRKGTQEERFIGTSDLPNFFRKSHGPGWALVGDAGHFKDPVLAHGMSDAFESAELLAEAIDSGLSGKCPLEDALADYERCRNEVAEPRYGFNCQMAMLEPPSPDQQTLFRALQGNQDAINRYMAVTAGSITPAEFFAPENVARIIHSVRA